MISFENHPLHPGDGVPLFIAAGPLKEAAHFAPFEEIEDPHVIPVLTNGGWVTPDWQGNATSEHPQDFVYYLEEKLAGNARGLPGSGIEGLRKLGEPIKRLSDKGVKTIIQVTNLPHETPADVIPNLVEEAVAQKPTAVEVNLSCPNGKDKDGNLHPPTCNDPEVSEEVMYKARLAAGDGVCLGAKDSPHASSIEGPVDERAITTLVAAINPYIDFLTGINTVGGQDFPELKCAGGKGGASGPAVAPLAREWLRVARVAADDRVAILSCGGVDSSNVATEAPLRLEMGALLVGGAQEFFRANNPARLAVRWAQEIA